MHSVDPIISLTVFTVKTGNSIQQTALAGLFGFAAYKTFLAQPLSPIKSSCLIINDKECKQFYIWYKGKSVFSIPFQNNFRKSAGLDCFLCVLGELLYIGTTDLDALQSHITAKNAGDNKKAKDEEKNFHIAFSETYFCVKCDGNTVMQIGYWNTSTRREVYVLNAFWHHLKENRPALTFDESSYREILEESVSVVFTVLRDKITVIIIYQHKQLPAYPNIIFHFNPPDAVCHRRTIAT